MDIIIDERLVERGVGTLESKDSKIYKNNNYYDVKLNSDEYGVESVKDLFAKVSSFLEDIKEKFLDKTILIVSRVATIRAFHYIMTGYDGNTNFLAMEIPNCSILEYEI